MRRSVPLLSEKPFRLEDVQEHRLLISYRDQDTTIPLKRDQFETLYQRISESPQPFDLDRLPQLMPNPMLPSSLYIHASGPTNEGVLKTPIHLPLLARRRLTYCRKPRPRNRP